MMQLVLPYTMQYFRPSKPIKSGVSLLWKFLSRKLRLTSYMFGNRVDDEEYTPAHSPWTFFSSPLARTTDTKDGSFRRVPANDHIALARDMRGTAEVDKDGEPLTEAARRIIQSQNAEAEKAGRQVKDDYLIVYMPPHFRWRLGLFIAGLWVVGSIALTAAIACPILLGRQVFKLFLSEHVHDGYSFFLGFYVLYGYYILCRAVDRLDKSRQRAWSGDEEAPIASQSLYVTKRILLWLSQISYMILICGFIIPTLLSLVVEVYLILPIRFSMNPSFIPRIRIVDMWALGLLYTRIALRTHHLHSRTGIARGLERVCPCFIASEMFNSSLSQISRNGWTNPDPWAATMDVFFPVITGLAGMLLLPALVVWFFRVFLGLQIDNRFLRESLRSIHHNVMITGFSSRKRVSRNFCYGWVPPHDQFHGRSICQLVAKYPGQGVPRRDAAAKHGTGRAEAERGETRSSDAFR
jgi:E3 ubiquitin-protein ligase MARCH6